jgi:hypothetical protein
VKFACWIEKFFCPDHQGGLANPDIDLLIEEDRLRCEEVLLTISSFASETFPDDPAHVCLDWLSRFRALGDEYQRIVVNSLVGGPLRQIIDKVSTSSQYFRYFYSFISSFICDSKMKVWLADYMVEVLESGLELFLNPSLSDPQRKEAELRATFHTKVIFVQAVQIFIISSISRRCFAKPDFLPRVLGLCAPAMINFCHQDRVNFAKFGRFMDGVSVLLQTVFNDLEVAKSVLFTASPSRTALFHFLRKFAFVSSFARAERPVPGDDLKATRASTVRNRYQELFKYALAGFESISATKLCFTESRRSRFRGRPSDANLEKILGLVQELVSVFNEWDLQNPVTELSILRDTFSLDLPLEEAFAQFVQSCLSFYDIPLDYLVEHLVDLSLIRIVQRPLMTVAALAFGGTPVFDRNGDTLGRVLSKLADGKRSRGFVPHLYSLFAGYLLSESDPTPFVAKAIEAFGLRWLFGTSPAPEQCVDPSVQICLLCRFFIQLMSNFIPAGGLSRTALFRQQLLQALKDHPIDSDFVQRTFVFRTEIHIALGILHEVGLPFQTQGMQWYKLNPEFESEVSPFWVLYSSKAFFEYLSKSIDAKCPSLLSVPRLDYRQAPLICRFVQTETFREFLIHSLRFLAGNVQRYGEPCFYCLMALIQMASDASKAVDATVLFEKLVESQVLEPLASPGKLLQPFVSLLNILKLSVPSRSAYFAGLISRSLSVPVSESPNRKRNRSDILASFAAQRSAFSHDHESELATIGIEDQISSDCYVCVKCHCRIDPASDIFGLNCTGVNFVFCPHYVHRSCFETSCCICARISAPHFIPILLPGFTPRQQSAAQNAICHLPNISDSLRRIGQVLDIEHSTTIPDEIVHVLQSVIFAGSDSIGVRSETDDPLLHFAFSLPSGTSQSSFESLVDQFREIPLFSLKGAQILWNCLADFGDNSSRFTAFDLSAIREIPPDLYIEKLPERFTDIFMGQTGAAIAALTPNGQVCCCLTCGAFFNRGHDSHVHPDRDCLCDGRALLVLIGRLATSILVKLPNDETKYRLEPPLYLSEFGDPSIGFTLGCPLFLSQQRKNEWVRRLITNSDLSIQLGEPSD